MAHPLAARMAALLNLTGWTHQPLAPDAARTTLATLNQARKTLPHPATPAYRLRQPVNRPVVRSGWPFRASDGCGSGPEPHGSTPADDPRR